MMQDDVERVAQAIINAGYNPATAFDIAQIAISAMTPDTDAIDWIDVATALHAGEDVGYDRGWNAAIEAIKKRQTIYIKKTRIVGFENGRAIYKT
jgi:hypothetical protein